MTMLDTMTLTVAALAGLECIAGRLGSMHWRQHRPAVMLGYLAAFAVCLVAGYLIWDGSDARWVNVATWVIAGYLLLTWGDWRGSPPLYAYRAPPTRYRAGDLVPSSQWDDGRR